MKLITKRIVSLLASVVTAASSLSLNFGCAFAAEQSDNTTSTASSDNEVKTGGLLGDLLSDEFDQMSNNDDEAVKKDYAIYMIDYDYSKENLVVNYSAKEDCTIFVGFYNDEGTQLYTSIYENVTAASDEYVLIQLPEVLPDYYLIRAYMIGYLQNPLTKPFEYNRSTESIQKILSKSPEDFDNSKVIRVSEEDNYNFIVTKNEHEVIYSDESKDTFVSENEDALTMTFDNVDKIKDLNKGQDVLIYIPDDILYFRVDNIEIAGSRAIITRQDLNFRDLIQFIKYESDKDISPHELPESTSDEYEVIDNSHKSETNENSNYRKPAPDRNDYDFEKEVTFTLRFNLAKGSIGSTEEHGNSNSNNEINGGAYLEFTPSLYLSVLYDDESSIPNITLRLESEFLLKFEMELSNHITFKEIPVFKSGIVNITIIPFINYKVTGYITVPIIWRRDYTYNKYGLTNIDHGFEVGESYGSAELEISIGLDLGINLLTKKLFRLSVAVEFGVNFLREDAEAIKDTYVRHLCTDCISERLSFFLRVTINLNILGHNILGEVEDDDDDGGGTNTGTSILKMDAGELQFTIKTLMWHVKDGIRYEGPCENLSHLIELDVYDAYELDNGVVKEGAPVSDAKLYLKNEKYNGIELTDDYGEPVITNSKGKAEVWIKDEWLNDETCVIIAESEDGNKGQVNVGRLFDPTLKRKSRFNIILDNNTDSFVPVQQGINCGLDKDDPKYRTVYNIDKRVGESFDTATKTLIKRVEPVDIVDVYETIELPSWVQYDITNTATGESNPPYDVKQITITVYKPTDDIICNMDSLGNCHVSGVGKIYNSYLETKLNEKVNENGEVFNSIIFDTTIDFSTGSFTKLPVKKVTISDLTGFESRLPSFSGNTYLTEINIPFCNKIPGSMCQYCTNLKKVSLHDGVESIGDSAFSNTSIEEFECPSTLKSIGNTSFGNCSKLSYVSFNYGLESIGYNAFMLTSIRKIKFPSTLKSIGSKSFSSCINLNTVELNEGLKEIPSYAFFDTMLNEIRIPDSVETICDNAFNNSKAKKIVLNEGLKTVGEKAFMKNNISKIEIPASVEKIDNYAFGDCAFLNTIIINGNIKEVKNKFVGESNERRIANAIIRDGVTEIPAYLFYGCDSLINVRFPEGLKKIGKSAFANCYSLKELYLPDSITEIESEAFYTCKNLSYVNIPKNLTEIEDYTFCSTGIKSITIPSNIKRIGEYAFGRPSGFTTPLLNLNLSEGITRIEKGAFSGNRLETINIPESVTYIGDGAFGGNDIRNVVVPKSVAYLGARAFEGLVWSNYLTQCIYILNPECEFDPKFWYLCSNDRHSLENSNTIIYGYAGSTAEKYVTDIKNGTITAPYKDTISFKIIDTDPLTTTVTTTNVTTTVTTKTTTVVTTKVSPDSECIMIALNGSASESETTDNILKSSELRFVDQQTADDNGVVSFFYVPDTNETWSFMFISEVVDNVIQRTIGAIDEMKTVSESTVCGDANGDGEIDMSDAVLIMQALANPNKYGLNGTAPVHLTLRSFKYSDVEGNGNGITSNDALQIQKYLLGQITSLSN